jgi:YVTN family beta-propeller protein
VLFVDVAKKAVVATVDAVGAFPRGIAISADGKKLYTANGASNDVAIIDVASKKVESRVAVPGTPWGIVLAP